MILKGYDETGTKFPTGGEEGAIGEARDAHNPIHQDIRDVRFREYTTKSVIQSGFVEKIGTWIGGTPKKWASLHEEVVFLFAGKKKGHFLSIKVAQDGMPVSRDRGILPSPLW